MSLGAAALVVSGVIVVSAPGRDGGATAGVGQRIDGYPQRISFDRPSPQLPERPGPLAATLFDNDFGSSRFLGVTSRGDLYELPVGANVLSSDGRLLLTGAGDWLDSRLAVHDLSTGDVRVFDDIGQSLVTSGTRSVPYRLASTKAVYWSPDGTTVLGAFGGGGKRSGWHSRLLDVSSGELTDVGTGAPAGFLASGEAITVSLRGEGVPDGRIVVTTTDAVTGETSDVALQLAGPWRADPRAHMGASVSPEGTLLLVEAAEGRRSTASLRLFSLADGTELEPRSVRDWDGCPPAWLDGDPVVPTATAGFRGSLAASAEHVTSDGSQPLVAVHHRMQSSCLQLTAAALEAGPHRALFGTRTALWTWYWWQLLVAASLAAFVVAMVVSRVMRVRRVRGGRSLL